VDGIVFAATDAKALGEVTKSAQQKNIPVANIDSGTDPQPPDVPLYATDNIAGAEKVADLMAEELGEEGGKVALVSFNPGSQTNNERTEGFKNGLKKHTNLELVAEQNSESDFNKALRITEDILSANPDLKAVFGSNESGALGAAAAVRRAGKAGDVKIFGWDAAPDEVKAIREGTITAVIVQNPFNMGFKGVNAVVDEIRKGTKPKSEDTGSTVVTKDNLNSPEVQAVLKPSCENPPT
jgi:ribose transport system substrate-binding protein